MVICLELGAYLHMAQLMPLPLTVSCVSEIQIGFTFLVPAHPGSPGQRAIKRVCVVRVCDLARMGLGAVIQIHLLIVALYKMFAYLLKFSTYFFSCLFTILLIHFFENRPARCRKRRLNLALVSFVLIFGCRMFCCACMFDLVVLDLVSICNSLVCIFVFFFC